MPLLLLQISTIWILHLCLWRNTKQLLAPQMGSLMNMLDLIDGFGIVDHDYKQVYNEATVTIPGDSERAPNEEGIALNFYVDPCIKKLSHNAHERNRRRKQNALYAQLQALLPNPNAEKRLSIPKTVCRTLKYIPELRNEITKLRRRRNKLLLIKRICERAVVASKSKANDGFMSFPPNVTVNSGTSEHCEVLVTIYTCRAAPLQSSLLVLIEKEGLEVTDASTFVSRHTICRILRVQMIKSKVDMDVLRKKILCFCENCLAIEFLKHRLTNCHQMEHRPAG